MAGGFFDIRVLTQEGEVFSGEISSLVAPGENGYFGIWSDHAPMLSVLGKGELTMDSPNGRQVFHIDHGFLETLENRVTVIVDQLAQAPMEEDTEEI